VATSTSDEIHIGDDDEEGGKICSSDEEEEEDSSGGESRDNDDIQLLWMHPEAPSEAARHRYSSTSNYCDDEGPAILPHRNKPSSSNPGKCRCCLLDSLAEVVVALSN